MSDSPDSPSTAQTARPTTTPAPAVVPSVHEADPPTNENNAVSNLAVAATEPVDPRVLYALGAILATDTSDTETWKTWVKVMGGLSKAQEKHLLAEVRRLAGMIDGLAQSGVSPTSSDTQAGDAPAGQGTTAPTLGDVEFWDPSGDSVVSPGPFPRKIHCAEADLRRSAL